MDHAGLERRALAPVDVDDAAHGDVGDRVERRILQYEVALDAREQAHLLLLVAVDERGVVVEPVAVWSREELEVEIGLGAFRRNRQGLDDAAADLNQRETHACHQAFDRVAVTRCADLADLLRLAERLPPADGRLLRRHRHQQRVLALGALVRGAHREVAGAERVAAGHLDGGQCDPHERFRAGRQRPRKHRRDDFGVGFVDRSQRL